MVVGLGADLQRLDTRQKLHRIRQPGGAGQLAAEQVWHQLLAQALIGALQQVLDKRALAPAHKRRRQGMAGHIGDGLDRPRHITAQAAQLSGHTDFQNIGFCQPRQHFLWIATAHVQGLRLNIEPTAQDWVKHSCLSFYSRWANAESVVRFFPTVLRQFRGSAGCGQTR